MCFDEGTLQAYLDSELDEVLKEQVRKHVDTCEKCSKKLVKLKSLNDFTDKTLKTSSINLNEAWENLNKKIRKEERGVFHMFKKYKKYVAAAAVVAAITASIALPPVQKVEAEILSLFRLNNFKAVTITPDDVQNIKNKFYQAGNKDIDLKQYGDIKVIGDYGSSKEFNKNNLDEIKSYVGFDFKIPQDNNDFKIRDSIYVQKGQSVEFKLNVDNINNLIKTFGGSKLLPENLNGKTFKIILSNTVHISSTDKNKSSQNTSYGLDIMKTPEIIVPGGVDIEKVRDAVINMPFIPDDIRRQIASIKDWKSTIPVPVSDTDTTKDITINGSKGIVISRKFDVSSDLEVYSNLALNDNGVIYLFNGNNMSPDELIKIAESMR